MCLIYCMETNVCRCILLTTLTLFDLSWSRYCTDRNHQLKCCICNKMWVVVNALTSNVETLINFYSFSPNKQSCMIEHQAFFMRQAECFFCRLGFKTIRLAFSAVCMTCFAFVVFSRTLKSFCKLTSFA